MFLAMATYFPYSYIIQSIRRNTTGNDFFGDWSVGEPSEPQPQPVAVGISEIYY